MVRDQRTEHLLRDATPCRDRVVNTLQAGVEIVGGKDTSPAGMEVLYKGAFGGRVLALSPSTLNQTHGAWGGVGPRSRLFCLLSGDADRQDRQESS